MNAMFLVVLLSVAMPNEQDNAVLGGFMYRSQVEKGFNYQENKDHYLKLDGTDRAAFVRAQQIRRAQVRSSATNQMRIELTSPRTINWGTPSFRTYSSPYPYYYNPYQNQYNNMYNSHWSH